MTAPLEMWMSPLTHRIYVGRSKNGVATSKQDVNLDEGRYRVTIKPEKEPTP
jgi:hypothetical protein